MNVKKIIIAVLVLGNLSVIASVGNELTKIVLHAADTNPATIERGTLMLYFKQDPQSALTTGHSKLNQNDRLLLHFSSVGTHTADIEKMLQEVEQAKTNDYQVSIERTQNGFTLVIEYDPAKISVSYDFADTINLQKSMVVRFHDVPLLKSLRSVHKPALITAWHPRQCVKRVVIDCGHGGSDAGAVSAQGVKEKDLALIIGNDVASYLQQRGIEVFLTRYGDTDTSFTQRTQVAGAAGASLLVSIHANYAFNPAIQGIESFYCARPVGLSLFSTLEGQDKNIAANFLLERVKNAADLGTCIHQTLIRTINQVRPALIDRKLKHAASQLLVGSAVPAVLIEVGFLSHKQEAELLAQTAYQKLVAAGIGDGIILYFEHNC